VAFGDVSKAVVVGAAPVRFGLSVSAELPLMVGGIPVFSRAGGAGKPFDKVVMDIPIVSGPYRVGRRILAETSPMITIPTTGRAI
jgi:microcin C transport system substrate-binding protein